MAAASRLTCGARCSRSRLEALRVPGKSEDRGRCKTWQIMPMHPKICRSSSGLASAPAGGPQKEQVKGGQDKHTAGPSAGSFLHFQAMQGVYGIAVRVSLAAAGIFWSCRRSVSNVLRRWIGRGWENGETYEAQATLQ